MSYKVFVVILVLLEVSEILLFLIFQTFSFELLIRDFFDIFSASKTGWST